MSASVISRRPDTASAVPAPRPVGRWLIARGLNNTDIARRLVVSDKTVRNHVSSVFSKLHVADRAQAIVRARESGLGGSGSVSSSDRIGPSTGSGHD